MCDNTRIRCASTVYFAPGFSFPHAELPPGATRNGVEHFRLGYYRQLTHLYRGNEDTWRPFLAVLGSFNYFKQTFFDDRRTPIASLNSLGLSLGAALTLESPRHSGVSGAIAFTLGALLSPALTFREGTSPQPHAISELFFDVGFFGIAGWNIFVQNLERPTVGFGIRMSFPLHLLTP